jgi:hypothetical protein
MKKDKALRLARMMMGSGDFNNDERIQKLAKEFETINDKREVFGKMVSQKEQDNMTMEMILIDIANGIREYLKRGGEAKQLHIAIFNSLDYHTLSDLISEGDAYLRGKTYE